MTSPAEHLLDSPHRMPLEINRPDPEIEKQWIAVAKSRMAELRTGKVKAVPAEEVLSKIRQRFA